MENIEINIESLSFENKKYDDFIASMKTLANIKADDIEINGERDKINAAIVKIVSFVRSNESANEMIFNMFGFMDKDGGKAFDINKWGDYLKTMSKKQYLYFIADLKIKATVYLLRIHRFLNRDKNKEFTDYNTRIEGKIKMLSCGEIYHFFGEEYPEEDRDKKILEYDTSDENGRIGKYIKNCNDYLNAQEGDKKKYASKLQELEADRLEEILEEDENNDFSLPLFQKYFGVDKQEQLKLIDDTYYLFDNSMKEIDFCGIGWNWLWKYESKKSNLFRCVGTDEFKYFGTLKESGRFYYQTMIKNIVIHMNRSDEKNKLASYSKNPYRDIYKYMSLNDKGKYRIEIDLDSGVSTLLWKCNDECEWEEYNIAMDERQMTFAMVYQADTNVVKRLSSTGDKKDFSLDIGGNIQEFSCSKNTAENTQSFSEFILDNNTDDSIKLFCVDILNNSVPYIGDVRGVFKKYTDQFPDEKVKGIQREIVSPTDDEVVMSGNTANSIMLLKSKEDAENIDLEVNTEYRIDLSLADMICLFREVSKVDENDILKRIDIKKDECNRNIECKETYKVNDLKTFSIHVKCSSTEDSDTNESKVNKEEKEKIVLCKIAECISNIKCENSGWKVKFIKEHFIDNYKGRKNYGNNEYKEGDEMISLCKKMYLK